MNNDFPRIITLLRKEKGLSQKQAAMELGVSQALLSHYEKGIRECGLDFVIHIADYYNVSCDYLLGRTPDRTGATLKLDDLPDNNNRETAANSEENKVNALINLNKKLIQNSVSVMFEILSQLNSKGLTSEVSSYLMVSVYKMIRTVYATNIKNPQAMFSVIPEMYQGLSDALQSIIESNAKQLAAGRSSDGFQGVDVLSAPMLSPDIISRQYPDLAPSLYNLIQKTEEKIKKLS